MLERLYTTKMSGDKKTLQNRFSRIRSRSGRLAGVIGIAAFGVVLAVILCISVLIAGNTMEDYILSEDAFLEYLEKPIGAIMAALDYVDDEKLVFHYLDGFFVVNQQTNEIVHKIDLKALNLAPHQQGSNGLEVKIDGNGQYAYLSSYGPKEEIKGFDPYVVDLESGEVKKGEIPEGTALFSRYVETREADPDAIGWFSDTAVIGDGRTYYLTAYEGEIKALQLVIVHDDGLTGSRYIFGEQYESVREKKVRLMREALPEGEDIITNSGFQWEVGAEAVKAVINKLSETRQMPFTEVKEGSYDVSLYHIESPDEAYPMLFVMDNERLELMLSSRVQKDEYSAIVQLLNQPESDLYQKTEAFLEQEFRRVFGPYYDIQSLTISNWEENGNEATFHYRETYLHYNRDPDQAEYIREARERSQEEYEALYNDYLAPKQSNYQFKVVEDGEDLVLYTNVSPSGTEWQPIEIEDYLSD